VETVLVTLHAQMPPHLLPDPQQGFRQITPGVAVDGVPDEDSGSGFRVQGSGFRVQGSGFRVQGSGFRVQGLGFRV
jgi:hypothetical protein